MRYFWSIIQNLGIQTKKVNKMMVKFTFDTYDSLVEQVRERVIDWINKGKVDDLDMNDPLVSIEISDDMMKSDREAYYGSHNYWRMKALLEDRYMFNHIFCDNSYSLDGHVEYAEMSQLMSAWQLVFVVVFMKSYYDFMVIWGGRRRKKDGNV